MLLNPYRFRAVLPPAPSGPSILASDPSYASVAVRMPMNGANGSTTVLDHGGMAWTASGNAQLSTSSPKYGSASLLLDGSGDYLSATAANESIGTGDFTVEAWIKVASLASDGEIFCISDPTSNTSQFNLVFEYKSTGALRGSIQNGSGVTNVDITTAAGLLSTATWYHVAFVADGSTARLYIDGVQRQSGAISSTRVQARRFHKIGFLSNDFGGTVTRYFNGNIDDLRVSRTCRYPSGTTFTPPAAELAAFSSITYTAASAFTVAGVSNDAQGVASDGTNVWFSSSSTLYKCTTAGAVVTSRSCAGDAPLTKLQINGLFIRGGVLYVSAADYTAGVGTSWIVEYDPDTLLPNGAVHTLDMTGFANSFSEGVAYYGGVMWVVFHSTKKVAAYDPTTWALLGSFDLGFTITGSGGPYGGTQGYDGIAWLGDYLLANIHEIYDQKYLDVYYWNGSGFDQIARIDRSRPKASQGLALDPTNPAILWATERNPSGTDGACRFDVV